MTGTALATGDFNRDGNLDLVTVHGNSALVWIKGPKFNPVSSWFTGLAVANFPSTPRDLAVLDYNQDGILDIAATLDSLAEVVVAYGHATGGAWDSTFSAPVVLATSDCWGLTVADINGDGSPDLLFSEPGCNSVVSLLNPNPVTLPHGLQLISPNGGEIWSSAQPPPGDSPALAAPDEAPKPLAGDGQIEWAKDAGVQGVDVQVSRDDGATWQTIGTNMPGTSMKWIVTPPGTVQGLVRVRDSAVQERMDTSDSPFNIEAPTTGAGPADTAPGVAALSLEGRNPAGGSLHFLVQVPKASDVDIRVFDASGRLVRTLAHGPWPAGKRDLVWDLRDDGGRTAARGIYFIQGRIGPYKATRKVVVLG